MATDKFASTLWQTRPVFISSTFKDMQAERDYLKSFVFPRLEEELRKGRLLLESIDLRQGVETADLASEEARERLVLKVCLDEINRSRPFLIVLLGDRYGWVPPEERMLAATQEVGFDADVHGKSVTALEIEFGILKQSPEQRRRSFFYFREPLPYPEMPESVRADFSDEFSTDEQTRARHGRLGALKQSLADDPELAPRVHNYRAEWDASKNEVTGLEAWGEQVYQHLLGELQAELAAAASQPPQTWEDQERAALAEFIEHRRRDFTGRAGLLNELQTLATSPTAGPLALTSGAAWGACLTSDPGSGKSAIFAELVTRLSADDSILLLTNAAGATPRGSQVAAMLERFIQDLADALNEANPLPEQASPDDVDALFASLLGRVAVKQRVVVLLDALNQFDPTPRAEYLTWLRPKQWPGNARLIATALIGPPAEALSQWAGIEKPNVPPLTNTDDDQDDVTAIARTVWQRYHRQVNPAVLRVLKEKLLPDGSFAAGNPLWLTLALEQLNLLDADDFARAEREFSGNPAERQRAMLVDTAERMPPTVAELYELLLAQSEKLFGAPAARAFAAVIAVSRFGWRETDLLALVPAAARVLCPGESVAELNDLRLAVLRRSFRAHLARRGTLSQLNFFHAQMRQAVEQRVLSDSSRRKSLHRTIADHLESLPSGDSLRDSELMVHLIAGDDRARAAQVYAELPNPSSAHTAATQALAQYVMLGAKDDPNSKAAWVTTLLTQPGLTGQQVANLGNWFNFSLHDALANTADLATRQSLLQATRIAQQRLAESDPANAVWQRDLSVSFSKVGDLATAQGNLPEAQRLFGESLRIRQRLAESDPANAKWQRDLSVSFNKLGDLSMAQGNLPEAQRLCGESLHIAQRLADTDPANAEWQRDLSVSFNKLGDLAMAQGNLPEAQRFFGESLRIAQRLAESDPANAAWQRDLWMAFGKLGDFAATQGDLTESQKHWGDAHQITQQLTQSDSANAEWQRDLSVSFNKLGDLGKAQGNLPEAQRLFGESLRIRQRLAESDPANAEWQRDLSLSFNKLGALATVQGNLPEAQRLFGESLHIRQRLADSDPANAVWQRDLSVSFNKLGDLATAQGNLPEAQRLFGESLRIAQRLSESDPANAAWQRDFHVSFIKLGELATAQGNQPEAQRFFSEALRIAQCLTESDPANAEWQHDVSVSLEKFGGLATAQRNLPEAQRLFGESLHIRQRLTESDPSNAAWMRDLSVSFNKLGDLATAQGNLPEAQRLFGESLRIRQRLTESDPSNAAWMRDLSVSFKKLGDLARAQGNLPEVQRLYGEQLRIAQRLTESDPANAVWQRDLWVSYWQMADVLEKSGQREAKDYWRKAHDTLAGMKRAGLFVSAQDEGFLNTISQKMQR